LGLLIALFPFRLKSDKFPLADQLFPRQAVRLPKETIFRLPKETIFRLPIAVIAPYFKNRRKVKRA
jgi:hypothetical protein